MKSDEIWWKPCFHQISSDFIRNVFLVTTCPWKKKSHWKSNKAQKTCTQNQIALQPFWYQNSFFTALLFLQQWGSEGYEKGNEINLCKGETNLWEGESNPCQREEHLCKGEASLCKGETFEKRCSPERNLEETQLAKVGAAVPPGQNQTNRRNQWWWTWSSQGAAKEYDHSRKKQDLVQTPDPPQQEWQWGRKGCIQQCI